MKVYSSVDKTELNTLLNTVKDRNDVPYYLFAADLIFQGGLQDFENKVTGEENLRLHETKIFKFRGYDQYLPEWYKNQGK